MVAGTNRNRSGQDSSPPGTLPPKAPLTGWFVDPEGSPVRRSVAYLTKCFLGVTGSLSRVSDDSGTTDRRVRRTRRALQEAFVALVLERGYERVSVDDITSRADVARPTFYAHYADKSELFTAVFRSLIEDLGRRVSFRTQSQTAVRTEAIKELYRHADEFRDLYRVCLSGAGDGRATDAYLDLVTRGAERNFSERISALRTTPRAPLHIMARVFAGAHIALLKSWLDGEFDLSAEQLASVGLDLLVAGLAWGQGIPISDISLATDRAAEGGSGTS